MAAAFLDESFAIQARGFQHGIACHLLWVTVLPAALVWWSWSIYPRRAARSSPFLNVEVEVTASSEGMKWHSTLAKGESGWAVYISVLESADHFMLYGGKNLFYIYPKRGLAELDSVERFRDLLRAHISSVKLLD